MVYITAKVVAGKREEFLQAIRHLIDQVRSEKGFRKASLYQDTDDADSFSLAEDWETREDLERHVSSQRFSVLLGALKVLCMRSEVRYDLPGHMDRMIVLQS